MIINRTLTTIANHICKRDMYISEQGMNLSQMYCDVICIGILIQSDYIAPRFCKRNIRNLYGLVSAGFP